ncbi:MAG: alpha-galactosidase, partial [Armatimonadetes bacterium]|nr:alpha-galactosidase [Armatimonadota bacterium]
ATAAPEIGGLHYNQANEIQAMDLAAQEKLPADHWWIDAGWYPCHGNWYNVGTWQEDPTEFPDGLRTVTDHARSLGMKQILWFEPERVTPGSELDLQHPEWLIRLPGQDNRLFNLGLPAAREFLTDLISQRITEYGVDLYRQDFNFDPLPYWRSQDAPDRQGLTEIKYVEGLLAFWDALRARHPGMFIDCCASGGRRNDLEVLRRAVPLLQSDYRFEPNGTQGHNYGVALWMPYHGTGGPDHYGDDAAYLYRSHMGPCHAFGPDRDDPRMNLGLLNRLASEERQVQPYYFGDYYPLTPWSLDNGAWMAWQYDRPDLSSGIVQAFRRAGSAELSRTFRLAGLDAQSVYRLRDFDTGRDTTHTGAELMGTGLTITLNHKPGSGLLLYRRLGPAPVPRSPRAATPG